MSDTSASAAPTTVSPAVSVSTGSVVPVPAGATHVVANASGTIQFVLPVPSAVAQALAAINDNVPVVAGWIKSNWPVAASFVAAVAASKLHLI